MHTYCPYTEINRNCSYCTFADTTFAPSSGEAVISQVSNPGPAITFQLYVIISSAGYLCNLSILFMRIYNLVRLLENLCVTTSQTWRQVFANNINNPLIVAYFKFPTQKISPHEQLILFIKQNELKKEGKDWKIITNK